MVIVSKKKNKLRFGIRGRLFVASLALMLIVLLCSGVLLFLRLKNELNTHIEAELHRHAATCKTVIEQARLFENELDANLLARGLSDDIDARVTIINRDGKVLGDSELNKKELALLDNHGDRPEVIAAFKNSNGVARRYSVTLNYDMLYVAAQYTLKGQMGVVRVARSLKTVDDASAVLYGAFGVAGLISLTISILISAFLSHIFSKTFRALLQYTQQVLAGKRVKPPFKGSDEISGLVSTVQKLAEQLQDKVDELAQERNKFEALLNGMNEPVIALDEHKKITLINRAGVLLFGLSKKSLGHNLLEFIRVPTLRELIEVTDDIGEGTREFELDNANRTRLLARATKQSTGGTIVVFLDVTELRQLENVRRDFVSNVSHELRTPVSVISAAAETLANGAIKDHQSASRFLDSILNNAERLASLISDLLDLAKVEEGKFDLEIEPISVNLVMEKAAATFEAKAMAKGSAIAVEPCVGLVVKTDQRALEQVLFNLVENAVKYSGEHRKIVIRAFKKADRIVIQVEDDGPGIDVQYRDRLFERFYRVDPGRSRQMGGTGLGLAIVKHLVSALGGTVGMEPAADRGSVFWVSLCAK